MWYEIRSDLLYSAFELTSSLAFVTELKHTASTFPDFMSHSIIHTPDPVSRCGGGKVRRGYGRLIPLRMRYVQPIFLDRLLWPCMAGYYDLADRSGRLYAKTECSIYNCVNTANIWLSWLHNIIDLLRILCNSLIIQQSKRLLNTFR